MLALQL